MTPMLDPGHIWNVIYNARSNKCHPPTSPNTAPATQNDSHAWSSSHTKRHLQCAEQQVSPSNLTKYCACHTEWLACLIVVTYETSFTMRGATSVTIQPHQILRLPHRMTRMLDRRHIWNVIYNARSNRCHHPTSPNTAPATKNDSTALSSSHMKRHFQCAEQQVSLSNLTKYCACHEKWHCKISKKISKNRWNVISNAGPIRAWSDHDPTMIRAWSDHENANRNPPRKWGYFSSSPRAFSIVKYNVSRPILHSNLHQILRLPQKDTLDLHQVLHLPRKVTLEVHQVLRLPHKMTRMLDRRHIWNLISNARSNRYHDPTSPNTAPGTKYDTARFQRKSPKTGETSFPMRGRSDHDPSMIRPWSDHDPSMIRPWKRKLQPASQVRLLFQLTTSIFYCKIQCFAPNLTFKPSPNTAPATKSDTWTSPSTAPATKSDTWTSPSTAPATKSDTRTSLLYSTRLYLTLLYLTLLYLTLLDTTLLYLTLLDSTWFYLTLVDSTWFYLTLVDSTLLYLTLLDSTWFYLTLLDSTLLDSTWLYSTLLDSTWFYLTLVDSTWFYLTLVDSTLLDSTWLYSTLLDSTWLYLILLDSTWFYSTRLYLTLLYSTWLYLILLDSSWLYLILLDSSWLYLILLDSSWLYSTLLDSTWLYLILLDSTWFYSTRLYLTLLDSTWLYLTLVDSTWFYLTLVDSTLLDSTWLYLTLLDSTWLYSTLLDSTLLDSTWHYSTWLYLTLTWLGCRSYIGSFSAKLPLISIKHGYIYIYLYIRL